MLNLSFSDIAKSVVIIDERGRRMEFPSRTDYVDYLVKSGVITKESELSGNKELVLEVYLDWLRRGQVGCIFAQLFGRRRNREALKTVVISDSPTSSPGLMSVATEIDQAVQLAMENPDIESISVLLPGITDAEVVVNLIVELEKLPRWRIDFVRPWRERVANIGLRTEIVDGVWAEILMLSPLFTQPPTRQGPITSLELRTQPKGSRWSKFRRQMHAAHLDLLPTEHFLSRKRHGSLFKKFTPQLRTRILGGEDDRRATAQVSISVPKAIWDAKHTNPR